MLEFSGRVSLGQSHAETQTFYLCPQISGPDDCEFDFDLMCHWRNDPNNPSYFNWERNTGGTPSSRTGPSGDHTSGSGTVTNQNNPVC